jgi:hypothetical protein
LTKKRSGEIARKRKQTAWAVPEEAGAGKSGMGRIADQIPAGRVTPPLQFKRKHQHRELGSPIRLPWRVYPRSLQIIEIDECGSVRQAADIHYSWAVRPAQQWHQLSRENKVTQIVCSKLHLEAVCRGLPARQRHHSCIIYQKIQRLSGMHPLREIADGREVGQIETLVVYPSAGHFTPDLLDRRLPLPIVAAGQNDLCPGLGQRQGRLVTETARSASNNSRPAELRGDFGLRRNSHGRTLLKIESLSKPKVIFGRAGSADWSGGSAPYRSHGRQCCAHPKTAGHL